MYSSIKLNRFHLNAIVNLHMFSFPNFLLTSLGYRFLYAFYNSLIHDNNVIAYGIFHKDRIIGFYVNTINTKGFYSKLFLKNIIYFIFPLLIIAIKNPKLIQRLFISFNSSNTHKIPDHIQSSLLSICVSRDFQNAGIGKLLLNNLENELIRRSVHDYYLTTDSNDNENVNIFYKKNKFILYSTFYQGKRLMNIYIKNI